VFAFVDSTTLCTSAPLVCKQWHEAAQCPLLWVPRLDPQLLAVAAQHQQQQTTNFRSADTKAINAVTPAACLFSSMGPSLAKMQQAVYGRNLLRNPCFLSSHNACRHNGSSSSGIMRKARAVLNSEQRLAWVSTVLRWQQGLVVLCCGVFQQLVGNSLLHKKDM
jgi:hypothetical protein